MARTTILIVDDDQPLAQELAHALAQDDVQPVIAHDGLEGLRLAHQLRPRVLVSDLNLPGLHGERLINEVRKVPGLESIPVLVITSDYERSTRIRLLQAGADHFIVKPVDPIELRVRVQILLKQEVEKLKEVTTRMMLEKKRRLIRENISTLERLTLGIVNVLESADAFSDPLAGNHSRRVAQMSVAVARNLGRPEPWVTLIGRYASLYDIGKVGLPDTIKWNVRPFSEQERVEMQKHTELGARLLKSAALPDVAQHIALFHHERHDGSGYPMGIGGDLIPLEARIIGVVDVWDALTSDRAWRQPRTHTFEEARVILEGGLARGFDPVVRRALFQSEPELIRIKRTFPDGAVDWT